MQEKPRTGLAVAGFAFAVLGLCLRLSVWLGPIGIVIGIGFAALAMTWLVSYGRRKSEGRSSRNSRLDVLFHAQVSTKPSWHSAIQHDVASKVKGDVPILASLEILGDGFNWKPRSKPAKRGVLAVCAKWVDVTRVEMANASTILGVRVDILVFSLTGGANLIMRTNDSVGFSNALNTLGIPIHIEVGDAGELP